MCVNQFIARRPLGTKPTSAPLSQRSSSTKRRIYKQFQRHEHKMTLISWNLTAVGLHSKYCIYLKYNCSSEVVQTSVFILAYPFDMYSMIKTVPFWSWKCIKITHKIIWIMIEACKPTSICLYVAYLKVYPNHSLRPCVEVTQLYSALWWLQENHWPTRHGLH